MSNLDSIPDEILKQNQAFLFEKINDKIIHLLDDDLSNEILNKQNDFSLLFDEFKNKAYKISLDYSLKQSNDNYNDMLCISDEEYDKNLNEVLKYE
jgi:hypothetical protein